MKRYEKPMCKSYYSLEIVDQLGFVQTQYAVQFSIQAIEFQVSENFNGQNQTVHTVQKLIKQSKKLS